MQITFAAKSENEGFARTAVAAFVSSLDPTIEELADIKTAVSEAVTNCIIHGYNQRGGTIWMEGTLTGRKLRVSITDEGRGIKDIKQALDKVINECNQYGNFLSQVFTITNVKELSAEEVEEIIKKNGGNSQASH